ncbi:MAG: hypothetical protein Q7T55_24475 [Solirubrobacteraceae bacterium]|nr:hypothetical protein [Solirubrobacteraceae bacterium]
MPVALLLTALAAGGWAAPASAATSTSLAAVAPKAGTNTRLSFKAKLDVSMEIEVKETYESIQTCTPGENGSVSYTFDYESDVAGGAKAPSTTEINLINGVGGTAKPSRGQAGGAKESGTPGQWTVSLDDCNDSTDVQPPAGVGSPQCTPLAGRVDTWLNTDGPSEEELTPLTSDGTLLVQRNGGGAQKPACLRLFQKLASSNQIVDWDLGVSAATGTGGINQVFAIDLPKLSRNLLEVVGKKARSARRFSVTGPCYATVGKSYNVGPTFGSPRYETCSVSGSGVLVITRTTPVKRLKF